MTATPLPDQLTRGYVLDLLGPDNYDIGVRYFQPAQGWRPDRCASMVCPATDRHRSDVVTAWVLRGVFDELFGDEAVDPAGGWIWHCADSLYSVIEYVRTVPDVAAIEVQVPRWATVRHVGRVRAGRDGGRP